MALKDTCKVLRTLLGAIQGDLDRAEAGNKAAAQRVRTHSIKFEKTAKLFRKESIKADKAGLFDKAKAASKKAPKAKKAAAPKAKKAAAPKAKAKKAVKRAPAKKAAAPKKRATAKLPKRKKK